MSDVAKHAEKLRVTAVHLRRKELSYLATPVEEAADALERLAAQPVKVKQLEWKNTAPGTFTALCGLRGCDFYLVVVSEGRATWRSDDSEWKDAPEPTKVSAQAAAQADFERRILSALEGQ